MDQLNLPKSNLKHTQIKNISKHNLDPQQRPSGDPETTIHQAPPITIRSSSSNPNNSNYPTYNSHPNPNEPKSKLKIKN